MSSSSYKAGEESKLHRSRQGLNSAKTMHSTGSACAAVQTKIVADRSPMAESSLQYSSKSSIHCNYVALARCRRGWYEPHRSSTGQSKVGSL